MAPRRCRPGASAGLPAAFASVSATGSGSISSVRMTNGDARYQATGSPTASADRDQRSRSSRMAASGREPATPASDDDHGEQTERRRDRDRNAQGIERGREQALEVTDEVHGDEDAAHP